MKDQKDMVYMGNTPFHLMLRSKQYDIKTVVKEECIDYLREKK